MSIEADNWAAIIDPLRDEVCELRAERDELAAALRTIADARPDRLNTTQHELWEVMRGIARAALAKAEIGA